MTQYVNLKFIFILNWVAFLASPSLVADEWFCREGVAERLASSFLICGIGEALSHEDALIHALRSARREFRELCEQSEDCQNQKVSVTPMRAECSIVGKLYKCYRLFEYDVSQKRADTGFEESMSVNENETDSWNANRFAIGMDWVSLSSEAFEGQGYFWSLGLNFQTRIKNYGDIELGGNLDIPIKGGMQSYGVDYYLRIPLYLNNYHPVRGEAIALFIAPEGRVYQFEEGRRYGLGGSLGWKKIGRKAGVSFRMGVSNLIDSAGLPPIYSMVLTWPSY